MGNSLLSNTIKTDFQGVYKKNTAKGIASTSRYAVLEMKQAKDTYNKVITKLFN